MPAFHTAAYHLLRCSLCKTLSVSLYRQHSLLFATIAPVIQPIKNRLPAVFLQAAFSEIQTHPFAAVAQHFHLHVIQGADVFGGEDAVGRAAVADLPVLHGDNVVGVVRGVVDVVQHDHDGFAVVVHRLPRK